MQSLRKSSGLTGQKYTREEYRTKKEKKNSKTAAKIERPEE